MNNLEKTKLKVSLIVAKAQMLTITSSNSGFDFAQLDQIERDEIRQVLKQIDTALANLKEIK